MFHSPLLDDNKKYAATNTAQRKRLIEMLKKKLTSTLITIWENINDCAVQYRCASEIYLISVLSQSHSIIIDWGISAPGHGK